MDETCEELPHNALKAEELLRTRGIRDCLLEEWERSQQILPKKGKKHFEPNNSWLQNVQIEKGLKIRRDLINIERVDRASELACAEWIPAQKKAIVTKRSGQDWNNFGLEKNGALYLIPEEALFLLETNCLELTWNGVPCSVQQAYEILIDDLVCTLEEYRVYSQLTRYGYRIQRYLYEEPERYNRPDDPIKRKVIVDPENGLRMCDSQTQNSQTTEKSKEDLVRNVSLRISEMSEMSDKTSNSSKQDRQNARKVEKSVKEVVYDVIDQLLSTVESQSNVNNSMDSETIENNMRQKNDMNNEENNRNTKVEIISDETLVGNIKILSDTTCKSKKETYTTSKWPGARIQRNVKLLPRRNDKIPPAEVSVIGSSCMGESSKCTEKRKISTHISESSDTKKSKHEVIELSDDEIQELPRPMTRMEMLDLLPNIVSWSNITQKIPTRYIPQNVKPQSVYQYNRSRIVHMQENDRRMRQNCKGIRNNAKQNAFRSNAIVSRSAHGVAVGNRNAVFQNQHARSPLCGPPRPFYSINHIHGTNFGFPYAYNNRIPFSYSQPAYALQNRITLMQQNVFHNMVVAFRNLGNTFQQSRSLTIQMNNFAMPPLMGGMRHPFIENQYRQHAFYQNFSWQQRFYQRRATEDALVHGNTHPVARRRQDDTNRNGNQYNHEIVNRPSFTTHLGPSSWTELKRIWCEEKTITIDDEDEVQVVEQCIKPLIGPKNALSLAEIFSKLAIIKSAPEKTVRRKKSRYKISYNVYSCNHHYRKANPGQPLYSLVVIRKENSFLQPIELNRLQQDAKGSQIILACVSMSISYIQPGVITMPNVI